MKQKKHPLQLMKERIDKYFQKADKLVAQAKLSLKKQKEYEKHKEQAKVGYTIYLKWWTAYYKIIDEINGKQTIPKHFRNFHAF